MIQRLLKRKLTLKKSFNLAFAGGIYSYVETLDNFRNNNKGTTDKKRVSLVGFLKTLTMLKARKLHGVT
jgi:hypothetical protein